MAKRRSGASRGRKKNPSSGWVYLFAGLSIGLLVAFLIYLRQVEPKTTSQRASPPAALKPLQLDLKPEPKPTLQFPQPEQSRFGFYNDLKQQDVKAPVNDYRDPKANEPVLLPSQKSPPSQRSGTYLLQAGSFRRHADADRRKAELALLGIQGRIEKVRVADGVWHRVRLGPFNSLEQANQVRTQLLSQSIKTILIKSK